MSVDLPRPICDYFSADQGDSELFGRCFAEDATVRDEGQTYTGVAAIKQWRTHAQQKYGYTIEPLASVEEDGKTVVTCRLTGSFPGSPIEVQFVFGIGGSKIKSLYIHS
jgi:SnoaL-like domain